MGGPPPLSASQPNGTAGAAARVPAQSTQERPKKHAATTESGKTQAQSNSRKLASEAPKKRKPTTRKRPTKESAPAEPSNGEVVDGSTKSRRRSRSNSAPASSQESSVNKASGPASKRPSTPRSSAKSKPTGNTARPKNTQDEDGAVNQSVQGDLLEESAAKPTPSAAKNSPSPDRNATGKLARVRSVAGGQKSKKR